MTNPTFRLLDFQVKNEQNRFSKKGFDNKEFVIQMFGMNEEGETCSIFVKDFTPFFYVKVDDHWGITDKKQFIKHIKETLRIDSLKSNFKKWRKGQKVRPSPEDGDSEMSYIRRHKDEYVSYYENSIVDSHIIERSKLYGFDNMKQHRFVCIKFKNTTVMNKVKNLWYNIEKDYNSRFGLKYKLKTFPFRSCETELYEAKLPPLLRFFHINEINPSGWIEIPLDKVIGETDKTYCKHEYTIKFHDIISLPKKETPVPAVIASYDIEASSSHGDFPVAIKTYRKLVGDIITHWTIHRNKIRKMNKDEQKALIVKLIRSAFKFEDRIEGIAEVFPKQISSTKLFYAKERAEYDDAVGSEFSTPLGMKVSPDKIHERILMDAIYTLLSEPLHNIIETARQEQDKSISIEDDDDERNARPKWGPYVRKKATMLDYLNDKKCDASKKLDIIDEAAKIILPKLEGDKVTFIGTTFMRVGESQPFLNHMAVLGDCDEVVMDKSTTIIDCYEEERDLLMGWTELMREQHPDILIGYNIFGFDWKFMCDRASELECFKPGFGDDRSDEEVWFSELSRNKGEFCRRQDKEIKIASGTHQLTYMETPGIIQIDLYNHFRREVNLGSYKLNSVASHFIGDYVKSFENQKDTCIIKSNNLMGLQKENYVCFELIAHSVDSYEHGKKFKVLELDESDGTFVIEGTIDPDKTKKLRWGLGKDDVSPQDIFELSKGSSADRAIIAKYCFQDCNLVHHLFRKNDILTGMSEQAAICSVPIDYVVMSGQGIKLLSFIAKKCREKNTLMPVVEKPENAGGYEGAICLKPKRNLYVEDPVAVVDYSSLYPSCMISENISHDSKVWTKEYDLDGALLSTTGERNKEGGFKYDELEGFEYVDVEYDRYEWIRKDAKKKEVKVKVGTKICRFAQYPNNKKSIMPSTLQGLLAARKAVRSKIKFKTLTLKDGTEKVGILSKKNDVYEVTMVTLEDERLKKVKSEVPVKDVVNIKDTYNAFMKNVYNQRQLSIKIVANSLYGQTGAKTSSFYEPDIAASTTATGRKLLTYGQRVIEEVYGDAICDTKYGKVMTKAEYIYGDSVTKDTPMLLRHKKTNAIQFKEIYELAGGNWIAYDGFKAGESNRREKQQSLVDDYQIYTSSGWSDIKRVIRHKTTKKIFRVTTHTGMVDVTEDHSLLDNDKKIVKPKDVKVGMKLLHHYPSFKENSEHFKLSDLLHISNKIAQSTIEEKEAFIYGFFFGDGSCGRYTCSSGIKYSWALNNKNYKLLSLLKSLCEDVFQKTFAINDTLESSCVYKLVPRCGNTKMFVDMFRPICYGKNENNYKVIPVKFMNADSVIRKAYLAGYYAADGAKCENDKSKTIRVSNKGKIGSAMLYYMFSSLGLNVSVNTRSDKRNITRLTVSSSKMRKPHDVIKKIEELYLNTDDFVYDIETVEGNFNTGYPLIVKNTDSVFFTFHLTDLDGNKIKGKKALEMTIELACEAGELATKFLKDPHDLEYEKTFDPLLLLNKKKYVGMLYEMDPNKGKRKEMGIVLKRRDNAPIVKDVYGGVIDILMKEHDIEAAIAFVKKCLQDIVDEKYPLEKLIISKKLNSFYKNPESIAHKVLADRMGKRDPGNKPSVGSRVPFVYIQTKDNVKLQGDKIESPDYIRANNIRPDYAFYITNQIMLPVAQVFALILEKIPSYKRKVKAFKRKCEFLRQEHGHDEEKYYKKEEQLRMAEVKKLIFEDALRQANNIKKGQKTIQSFFK